MSWGGIVNTSDWRNPAQRVTGLIMPQILPCADPQVVQLSGPCERGIYAALKAA